ncbi:MAG: MATE family efflux transporter, partial [Phycisphaerales bacterium]|nr:MATE family efflux transporter [Phycisphaerales bacterium]
MMTTQPDNQAPEGSFTEPGGEAALGAGADSSHEPSIAEIEAHPFREMLTIAAPTVVTMTSYTVMQFIDAQMVLRIGPEPVYVSAQGNGGMLAWLIIAIVLGLTGVVNSYVSQNLGAGRPREGAAYAWNAVWLSVAGWTVLMLPMIFLCPLIFSRLGHDETLLGFETEYAQIMLFGGLFTTTSRGLGHYFYGMHKPMTVMIAVLTANAVNVLANWVLIFGHWGVPAMGVAGAAIGTVIGGLVELAIPFAVFLGPRYAREFSTRVAWRPSVRHTRDICRIGWPGALMFFNDMVCWGYLMIGLIPMAAKAAGQDPVVANTAGWIGLRYMHLSFMPTVGLSIALTAIVGKCMGMNRPELAASRTWLGM